MKLGVLARQGFEMKFALVVPGDAMADGEAQAGAFGSIFRCEERVE